jgi:predicted SprT family Zn-dependent metalloprotease
MILDKSTHKNKKSKYICDSCEKVLERENRVVIDRNKLKKYDLCKDCWRKIRIIVEKHKLRKDKEDEKNDNVG